MVVKKFNERGKKICDGITREKGELEALYADDADADAKKKSLIIG